MGNTPLKSNYGLLYDAQVALHMLQGEFADRIGVPRRSFGRWKTGESAPTGHDLVRAAREVFAKDRNLAAELAHAGGSSLIALGLERPPPPVVVRPPPPVVVLPPLSVAPAPPPRRQPTRQHLVDSALCAAAEAVGMTPQAIRPAIQAALARVVEVGLTAEEAHEVLSPVTVSSGSGSNLGGSVD